MSQNTILEISVEQQAWMLNELRRCRYGYMLALHILLLVAKGKTPSAIADFLCCSRSSVYRAIAAWRDGTLHEQWWPHTPETKSERTEPLTPFQRTLLWVIKQPPRIFGWCRTRWSCAALALQIANRTGATYSRETIRRELLSAGYVWKRAKLTGRDDDPQRARKLARIRDVIEQLQPSDAFFWVDELDIHLLAKVGYQWMFKGTQTEVPTPGQNEKQFLAGALDYRTGRIHYVIGKSKNNFGSPGIRVVIKDRQDTGSLFSIVYKNGRDSVDQKPRECRESYNFLFRQLLTALDKLCGPKVKRIFIVADNYKIHKAKAVERWLAQHPRFQVLWLPSYCPQANPIERAFGDVHDKCTRNHTRKCLNWLIWE
jgi:putative transposase